MSTAKDFRVVCTICDAKGSLLCVQCRNVHYCSTECQQTDWPTHKLLCISFTDFQVPPDPAFRRAILFPDDQKKPTFIWVEFQPKDDGFVHDVREDDKSGAEFELRKMGNLLGAEDARADMLNCRTNVLRNRKLDHTIELVFRDGFLFDGSSPNESVAIATKGAHAHKWAGNIVVFRKKCIFGEDPFYGDMTLGDFRHTVDFFVTYKNEDYEKKGQNAGTVGKEEAAFHDSFTPMSLNPVKGELKEEAKGEAKGEVKAEEKGKGKVKGKEKVKSEGKGGVKGVRISCEADLRGYQGDKYIQVEVTDKYLFANANPVAISRLIELPIVVRKGPPPRDTFPTAADNQEVTFLHLDPGRGGAISLPSKPITTVILAIGAIIVFALVHP